MLIGNVEIFVFTYSIIINMYNNFILFCRYKMPTRRKVTETIEEAYKLQVLQIKKELNVDADDVNVTTDIWSSRNVGSYIGVTGQWASVARS